MTCSKDSITGGNLEVLTANSMFLKLYFQWLQSDWNLSWFCSRDLCESRKL